MADKIYKALEITRKAKSEVCPHQKWEGWFAKLSDIGTLNENVATGVTADVLCLLMYASRAQLEALAKLARAEEGCYETLQIEARKRSQKVLEKAYEVSKVIEEEVLDGVTALGVAYIWMRDGECKACFERSKDQDKYEDMKVFYLTALEGRRRVLGEEHKQTLIRRTTWGSPFIT